MGLIDLIFLTESVRKHPDNRHTTAAFVEIIMKGWFRTARD